MQRSLAVTVIAMLSAGISFAQIQVSESNNLDLTVEHLVQDVFLGNGVKVLSVKTIGSGQSIGQFTNAQSDIDINAGIVLSTGSVRNIDKPNNSESTGDTPNKDAAITDPDLQAISNESIKEVTGIEVQFIAQSDLLEFRYVFASEEYPEWNCSRFNDVFAFFVSGADPSGGTYDRKNIALVPDPADPTGNTFTDFPVWTNSVNNGVVGMNDDCSDAGESLNFTEYYNDNTGSSTFTFDGFLDVFKARVAVEPCQVYTIKLIIGDNNDFDYDSAVFLEANSLNSTNHHYYADISTGQLTEDCADAVIGVELSAPAMRDTTFAISVLSDQISDATQSQDYILSDQMITVRAGSTRGEVTVSALGDSDAESIEQIRIVDGAGSCSVDTLVIDIIDNELSSVFAQEAVLCEGATLQELDLSSDPPESRFNSTFEVRPLGPVGSERVDIPITVDQGGRYFENMIGNVCLDGISHDDAAELSVFLRSPSGQTVRLADQGDLSGSLFSESLCFKNLPLYDRAIGALKSGQSVSGTWTIIVIDNQPNSKRGSIDRGILLLVNPAHFDVTITDLAGASVDINAPITSPTQYIINGINQTGCTVTDTVSVDIKPIPTAPEDITCTEIDRDHLQFSWEYPVADAEFEVQIAGSEWISVGQRRTVDVRDLEASTTVLINVRAVDGSCAGAIADLICGTPACIDPEIIIATRGNSNNACTPNGFVQLRSDNTKGPYVYELDGVASSAPRFESLDQGTYKLRVTDGYGCSAISSVTINGVPELVIGFDKFDALCGQQGFVDLFVEGGSAPYRYAWSNGTSEKNANGLDAGSYTVTVTDASGCSRDTQVTIVSSAPVSVENLNATDAICGGSASGSVTYDIAGGEGPFITTITDDASGDTINAESELVAGSYTIEVVDAQLCVSSQSFVIGEPQPLMLELSPSDARCDWNDDGSISSQITGGVAPYTYAWSNGASSATASALSPGDYQLHVTDANGCVVTEFATVSSLLSPELAITTDDISCPTEADGTISVTVTNADFTMRWDDGPTGTQRIGLSEGTYCGTITLGNGCSRDTCISITAPEPIQASIDRTDNQCYGIDDGVLQMRITNGVSSYQITLNGEAYEADQDIRWDDLAPGGYTIDITDANGCRTSTSATISAAPVISTTALATDVNCAQGSDGTLRASIIGMSGTPTYSWRSASGQRYSGASVTGVPAGKYYVDITNAIGCSYTDSTEVREPVDALFATAIVDSITCYEDEDASIEIIASGGTGPYTYSIDGGQTFADQLIYSGIGPGSYQVVVADQAGCDYRLDRIEFSRPDPFVIDIDAPDKAYEGQDLSVSTTVTAANGDYDLIWTSDPEGILSCSTCDSVVINDIDFTVFLSVEAIDANGCMAEASKKILIQRANHVAVPTAFTPNGDGANDILHVYGTPDAVANEFSIFSASGVLLYMDGDIVFNQESKGWDGTYKGKMMPSGSYIWAVLATFPDGQRKKFSGTVQLIR